MHVINVVGSHDKTTIPLSNAELAAIEASKIPSLKSIAADQRWRVETGGCPWNGWVISTDRESQSKLIAAFVIIGAGLRSDGEGWKFADGKFRALSNAEAASMISSALTHIKAAFAVEDSVLAGIEAGTITTSDQVLAAEWPRNS